MKIILKLARIGMNMQEATIAEWFKKPGEVFSSGEFLYSIETDKVTQEVEATGNGKLIEILVPAGAEVPVGTPICVIEADIQKHR